MKIIQALGLTIFAMAALLCVAAITIKYPTQAMLSYLFLLIFGFIYKELN